MDAEPRDFLPMECKTDAVDGNVRIEMKETLEVAVAPNTDRNKSPVAAAAEKQTHPVFHKANSAPPDMTPPRILAPQNLNQVKARTLKNL